MNMNTIFWSKFSLAMLLLFGLGQVNASVLVIKHAQAESQNDPRSHYFLDLLRLTLDKTVATDGPYSIQECEQRMPQRRALQQMQKQRCINLVWTMTNTERERQALAVRIPLLKGLLGQRVLLIRKHDAARFKDIKTLSQLGEMLAGQGMGWPDVDILKANQLPVIEGTLYEGLFGMLHRGRFDYMPRGLNETEQELRQHPELDLMVEPHLLLSYTAPIYFFVRRDNYHLAARLEKGLRLAIEDGSFDALFKRYRYHELLAQLEQRRVLKLYNVNLPAETPVNDDSLWVIPERQRSFSQD
ncbi:hypothetical protein GCM10007414_28290 [Agarivorans gilvus]|jgi:hypothetical protein|uniref:Solute-binding protein family 3/N-terminal domain-containing protein n=2 Tax=Agarivorans gilvus TaxID=680279 RepID=A0ABQ1I6D8_9ALTE|nr:hypothetical protein GCM10007414_28290 [Agarivorans gilvus]